MPTALLLVACGRFDNPESTREIRWVDPTTAELAERACYDCHSNHTDWPWYSVVPGVGAVVSRDVHRARCHVNFSEWDRPNGPARDAPHELLEGEMPLPTYEAFHPHARLTDAERRALAAGITATLLADPPLPGEPCEDGDDDDDDDDGDDD